MMKSRPQSPTCPHPPNEEAPEAPPNLRETLFGCCVAGCALPPTAYALLHIAVGSWQYGFFPTTRVGTHQGSRCNARVRQRVCDNITGVVWHRDGHTCGAKVMRGTEVALQPMWCGQARLPRGAVVLLRWRGAPPALATLSLQPAAACCQLSHPGWPSGDTFSAALLASTAVQYGPRV